MKKKIKCWIEINQKQKDWCPTVSMKKPFKRDVRNGNEFGYKSYECNLIIGKELYSNKKDAIRNL